MDSAGIIKGNTANGCGYGSNCASNETIRGGTIRGVCPEGWHLPSYAEWNDDEWGELVTAVGGFSVAGKMLKSETGWESYSGIYNADAFGFSALPAGMRSYHGDYGSMGFSAYFWSSSEGGCFTYSMGLSCTFDDADLYNDERGYGFSVRCLKD